MKGKSALFFLSLAAAAGAFTFQTSYEVQEVEEKLASLNRKIVSEQESIQILKAEWSYLNDPTRLETLAHQHLALQPTDARQFVALDVVPLRPADAKPDAASPTGKPGDAPAALPTALPPMARALPDGKATDGKAPAGKSQPAQIIPASAPAKPAPIKPAQLIPAAAKAPALPTAGANGTTTTANNPAPIPAALPAAPLARPTPAVLTTNRPTEVAARPPAPPAKTLTPPAGKTAPAAPTHTSHTAAPPPPAATDSIGVLVARLGAAR